MNKIIKRNEGFNQVCVWPGTIVNKGDEKEFEKFMKQNLGARVQYLEQIITNPDIGEQGNLIQGTGGRNDIIFAVHDDDINRFAIARFEYGIRWIEDALSNVNNSAHLYPTHLHEYKTWNADVIDDDIENLTIMDRFENKA